MANRFLLCFFGSLLCSLTLFTSLQLYNLTYETPRPLELKAYKPATHQSINADGKSGTLSHSSQTAPNLACTNVHLKLPLSNKAQRLKRLRWLHIPKTGTSFMATLWNYGCGQKGIAADIMVDKKATSRCKACYDIALIDRFPIAEYCDTDVFLNQGCSDGCGHTPLNETDVGKSIVSFFRKPSQRLISAYHDNIHSFGIWGFEKKLLKQACHSGGVAAYVRFPGIAGCTARMLTGSYCADPKPSRFNGTFDGGKSLLQKALDAVEKLAFVGLTERWDESICLFHRMFGGRIHPGEFQNFHPADSKKKQHKIWNETLLDGFNDSIDELIYAAAVKRFEHDLAEHVPAHESVCADIKHQLQLYDALKRNCSCEAIARQCGVSRLAGIDCGRCPKKRLTFVRIGDIRLRPIDTIRQVRLQVQCEEGQCLIRGRPEADGASLSRDFESYPEVSSKLFSWIFT